jgi:GntR family histidine utilization transcriptional repressor
MTVDRDSMIPMYEQVKVLILSRIESGEWPAGARLPSEPDLAEAYQVNRDTIRKAIRQLQDEGRVKVVRGKGTFSLGSGQAPLSYRSRVLLAQRELSMRHRARPDAAPPRAARGL